MSKMYEAVESLVRERIAGQAGKVGGSWYVGRRARWVVEGTWWLL